MSFDVRPAVETDYEQLCALFDELDELVAAIEVITA